MSKPHLKLALVAILATQFLAAPQVPAQSASAVPKLDPDRLTGTYYEIARYPIRREKQCMANEMVLYALGDKKDSFQIVTTCEIKEDDSNYWDKKGKFDDDASGKLRLSWIWPFSSPYWILAIAPDYSWALVGSPNHKSLWILSHTPTLSPDVLTSIRSKASAQGFDTAKLITMPQHPGFTP